MSAYLKLKVTSIIHETADAITLRLQPVSLKPVSYKAGQFLTFIFNIRGRELRRSYSLSSSPETDADLAVTVKRIVNGEVSTMLFEKTKVGDELTALPPAGRFTVGSKVEGKRDVFLIAAGSGITPVYSILKSLLHTGPLIKITLIYSNRNESSTIFYRQLLELEAACKDRFTCIFIFSDPADKNYRYRAHLNLWLLEELINENLIFERNKAEFFLCGPFPFMRMAETMIVFMGFEESRIHKERFVILAEQKAIDQAPLIEDTSEKRVEVNYTGYRAELLVPYGKTILKAAREQGVYIPYSCLSGICGTCAALCKKGEVKMSANEVLTSRDLQQGWVLTCTGYPATARVVLEVK